MFLISTQLFQEMSKQVLLTVHRVTVMHPEITPSCKTHKNAPLNGADLLKNLFQFRCNVKDGVHRPTEPGSAVWGKGCPGGTKGHFLRAASARWRFGLGAPKGGEQ